MGGMYVEEQFKSSDVEHSHPSAIANKAIQYTASNEGNTKPT